MYVLQQVLLVLTGVPNLIRANMVKPGACIIDVGITRIIDKVTGKSKLVGDVDFDGEFTLKHFPIACKNDTLLSYGVFTLLFYF